jgi:antitoxin CptB
MDERRKRLLYRATHRGTKESDAIVGGFVTAALPALSGRRLAEAEALIEESDLDLMDWIMGRAPVPERWRGTILDEVMAHYRARTQD